jgi:two-component system sensor histidine kinase KdpD
MNCTSIRTPYRTTHSTTHRTTHSTTHRLTFRTICVSASSLRRIWLRGRRFSRTLLSARLDGALDLCMTEARKPGSRIAKINRGSSPKSTNLMASGERPNPDELLARLRSDEILARRGKLRIFFGYAAGVGKTFAMLEAARREKGHGVDVVVGYVEPHGRPETEKLLEGLEQIPHKLIPYRGVNLREFDLDAALARKPKLILVDELAHTNAEGSRHAKRWQDIEELLDAGIDVWTTLNVQHVESLNDVVAQVSGVVVRETLPDAVLERADEIELIDITPEELIERLKAGKIYVTQQAERALQNFFHKGNLSALRELLLRQAARRLSRDVDAARTERAATAPWDTGERLLVCVGPSPTSPKLIRRAKRMASATGAEWLAVAVDTGGTGPGAERARQATARHLQFAEELGAETHMLVGADVASAIVDYGRARNVTRIIVGKTALPRWRRLLFGTVVDALMERSGDIDVYAVRAEHDVGLRRAEPTRAASGGWDRWLWTAIVVAVCGLIGWSFSSLSLGEANVVMVFLLGVAFIVAAVASVLVFDFFFVEPYFSFTVSDTRYLFTFAVMLAIGLIISTLTARVRERLRVSQQMERRTGALYRLTRTLGEISGTEFLVQAAGKQLAGIFEGDVAIYLREEQGGVDLRYGDGTEIAKNEKNGVVARWVADNGKVAGAGTDTLPNASALFVPLIGSQHTVGSLGVRPVDPLLLTDPDQRHLLETCASLIALSIERDQSVLEAQTAQLQVQTEQLRNSLLSSVSHDLRTPLAAIAGAASNLLETGSEDGPRREMLQGVVDESRRLSRLVDNLLDMTRLEAGEVQLNRQWHVLEEIVGSAMGRLQHDLAGRPVKTAIPADLPLVSVDGVLLEQVFVNLLENAVRYTPAGSEIDLSARKIGGEVEVRVADRGPGIPSGSEERIFDKFVRGETSSADGRRGVGLGLAICRGIIRAHGGEIQAVSRTGGGAEFIIRLPCLDGPRVALDDSNAGTVP